MEKIQPQQEIVSLDSETPHGRASIEKPEVVNWQPGYRKRFPYKGAICLLLALLTIIGCIAVLCLSNGKSSAEWPHNFPPNVALSTLNAIGTFCLMNAFTGGISIAWWRKAMNGVTITELHQSWSYTTSSLGILPQLLHLDVIGVAVIATKLVVIDNIFYQRATTGYVGQDIARPVSMLGVAATEFPTTGYVVSEGFAAQTACNCFMIGDVYTPVLNTWETSNGFFQGYNKLFQACDGVCYTHINAMGFEIDCSTAQNHTDIAVAPIAAYNASSTHSESDSAAWSDIPIFNSSFYMSFADQTTNYSSIVLNLHYFQSDNPYNPSGSSCSGQTFDVQCTLRPAMVSYPVTVTNFSNPHVTNGVMLGSGANTTSSSTYLQASGQNVQPYSAELRQAEGFEVLSYLYPNETGILDSTTYLGGIANALHIALSSTALITYQGSGHWSLAQQGTLSQTMMYGPPNMGSCDCSFRSQALDTIIASINQLTFLTATGMIDDSLVTFPAGSSSSPTSFLFPKSELPLTVNTSTPVTIQGVDSNTTTYFRPLAGTVQIRDITYYKTHYLFMGLGAGTTLVCVIVVASLYWRYGQLGRAVTLGPIEVAGAFGAPILTAPTDPTHSSQPRSAYPGATHPNSDAIRPMSMAPHSPIFAHHHDSVPTSPTAVSFANVDDLLATVGDRKIMYGFVDVEEDIGHPAHHHTASATNTAISTATATGDAETASHPHTTSTTAPHSPGGLMVPSTSRKRRSQVLTFAPATGSMVRPASGVPMSPTSNKHTFSDDGTA